MLTPNDATPRGHKHDTCRVTQSPIHGQYCIQQGIQSVRWQTHGLPLGHAEVGACWRPVLRG